MYVCFMIVSFLETAYRVSEDGVSDIGSDISGKASVVGGLRRARLKANWSEDS